MEVDGSPRANGPGNLGEDHTANAGRPGNYWGLVTDRHGNPITQGLSESAPGFYVSTTSLQDESQLSSLPAAAPTGR